MNLSAQKRGVVLMVVLTAVTLLIVIVQQIAFDTQVEYKNGVSNYHSLRAYHAAKSGVELALLNILTYKKIHELINANKNIESFLGGKGREMIRRYTDQTWQKPLSWPPFLPDDLSDIRKGEVQEILEKSLLDADYNVQISPEESRINLNGMISPIPPVREWTRNTFYNLLIHLRNQNTWLQEKYSVNDLKNIQQNIVTTLTDPISPIGRPLNHWSELEKIEDISPELIEWIRPYISFYSTGGIQLQYASPVVIQSLHENIDKNTAEQFTAQRDNTDQTEEQSWVLDKFEQVKDLWIQQNMDFLVPVYGPERENKPGLQYFVFDYDAPQNFRITSRGASGQNFHTITAVFYDPHASFKRVYTRMQKFKEESGYKAVTKEDPRYSDMMYESSPAPKNKMASPFIIYWKDVN